MNKKGFAIGVLLLLPVLACAQAEWKMLTRMSFYTQESLGEVLLHIPSQESGKAVSLTLSADGKLVFQIDTVLPVRLMQIPVPLSRMRSGENELVLWLSGSGLNLELTGELMKLADKPNQVKIDRLNGSLITGDRLFFPYGFYNYSPVQPTLAEEEVVRGFNMLSPYQRIDKKTRTERQAWMDRCARLGMKVHFNLLSVAAGGGVGSGRADAAQTEEERLRLLRDEVNHFKDHPALLAWYISDEPTGHGATPEAVRASYELVRSLDPWHPVTVVFMAPMRAREYADGMDIVMADPYPVPNSDPASVGDVIRNLRNEFYAEKPVWMVPQAFGGSEHWAREPSLRELRLMTWLSVVEGATGIQFFIRHGRNGFPKSTATWDECGRIAMEINDLQNYLLLGTPISGFSANQASVRILAREYQGDLLLVAVNRSNDPAVLQIEAPFSLSGSTIGVLYENRVLQPDHQSVHDLIDGYGVRIYRITGYQKEPAYQAGNLIRDPGFEDLSSPGVPAACYARVGDDRGATYLLDPVMPFEGRHALRMVCPADNQGAGLSFFPVRLASGTGYTLRVQARFDTLSVYPPRRSFFERLFGLNTREGDFFRWSVGTYAAETRALSGEWAQYRMRFSVPDQGSETILVNPYLELTSQGRAWFDQLELYPDPLIEFGVNPETGYFEVSASTTEPEAAIRYTLDGRIPVPNDPLLTTQVVLKETARFTAAVFLGDERLNHSSKPFFLHQAVGRKPVYQHLYNERYHAGGEFGLVDGIRGTRDYRDGRWQGFMRRDLDVVIDLGEVREVSQITVGCLQDTRSWIFMPQRMEFWGTAGQETLVPLGSIENDVDPKASGAIKKDYTLQLGPQNLRYIRVLVKNLGLCPDWHNGKGSAAYLFVDEIIVE